MILLLLDRICTQASPLAPLQMDMGWQHKQSADQRVLGELCERRKPEKGTPGSSLIFPAIQAKSTWDPGNQPPQSGEVPCPAHSAGDSQMGMVFSVLASWDSGLGNPSTVTAFSDTSDIWPGFIPDAFGHLPGGNQRSRGHVGRICFQPEKADVGSEPGGLGMSTRLSRESGL
ncbi:unnamed protein product [Rangifer tarandus platyrhynchus]|uniref:Uncharacterized protein n=1 Tax=Rangifer tarandus platyrhynchus TaxID=3082113 RepID=A0AC59YEL5_RANTA